MDMSCKMALEKATKSMLFLLILMFVQSFDVSSRKISINLSKDDILPRGQGLYSVQKTSLTGGPPSNSAPAEEPVASLSNVKCLEPSRTCRDEKSNVTACVHSSASKEALLFVKNDGEIPVMVNITFSSANTTFVEILLEEEETTEINITENIKMNSSLQLKTEHGECIIHLASPKPKGGFHGLFLVFGICLLVFVLIIFGGVWAWHKLATVGQQGGGIPYQPVQVEHTDNGAEAAEGYRRSWEDWLLKAKTSKSSVVQRVGGNESAKGLRSRPPSKDA